MPHVGGGGGDDLASSDEIKVFKDEGEEEKRSSENLTDLKSSLVTEGEEVGRAGPFGAAADGAASPPPSPRNSGVSSQVCFLLSTQGKNSHIPGLGYSPSKNAHLARPEAGLLPGKSFEPLVPTSPLGYMVPPYPHPNGTFAPVSMVSGANFSLPGPALCTTSLQVVQANKMTMVPPTHPGSPLPFMMYNSDAFAQPPPAHMGIPPVHIDPKTGIPRPSMYPLAAAGQYAHPMFSPDFTQQIQWHTPAVYPLTSAGFRGPYPATLPVTSASLPRFSPPSLISSHPGLPPHPVLPHPALVTGPKPEMLPHLHENNRRLPVYHMDQKVAITKVSESGTSSSGSSQSHAHHNHHDKKKALNHIKKPLNAFMLYMKEMRAKVVAECTLKESAAINQILGRRWHSLSRDEQAKYYDMARKERQLHMQLYPGWSARDNYAQTCKKKKRKKDKNHDGEGNNPKKCRARFGLDQQSSWCKPCRRKKKCIRYLDGADHSVESEDNMGSAGSVEAPTPDSKSACDSDLETINTSSELSLSSPQVPTEPERKVTCFSETSNTGPLSPRSHPLSIQHLAQPHCPMSTVSADNYSSDTAPVTIPQLPTPPSTDSSTATAPPMLTVT